MIWIRIFKGGNPSGKWPCSTEKDSMMGVRWGIPSLIKSQQEFQKLLSPISLARISKKHCEHVFLFLNDY